MEIPESVRDDLESRANVVGTCVGERRVGGQSTGEECVVVLVDRKRPEDELDPGDVVPEYVEIDGEEVRTDVQEVGDVRAQAARPRPVERRPNRKRRWRPAPAGVSFAHPESTAGTLGSPPLENEHGLLAPVATIEGTGLRRRTRRALVATYGKDAVEAGGPAGPDFRVDGGLVTLTVVLARTAEEAVAAVGRAMAHATVPGDVPVVAYPADERTDGLDRLARRVPVVPVETRADRA